MSAFPDKPVLAPLSLNMPTLLPQATRAVTLPHSDQQEPEEGETLRVACKAREQQVAEESEDSGADDSGSKESEESEAVSQGSVEGREFPLSESPAKLSNRPASLSPWTSILSPCRPNPLVDRDSKVRLFAEKSCRHLLQHQRGARLTAHKLTAMDTQLERCADHVQAMPRRINKQETEFSALRKLVTQLTLGRSI